MLPQMAPRYNALLALLVMLLLACMSAHADDSGSPGITGPEKKKELNLTMGCQELETKFNNATPSNTTPFKVFHITKAGGYAHIQLHLVELLLPVGCSMVLRSVEGGVADKTLNMSTKYPSGSPFSNFLAPSMYAKEFQIELYRDDTALSGSTSASFNADQCVGFSIDYYYYVLADSSVDIQPSPESICLNDETGEAICYNNDNNRTTFLASMAVARMLVIDSAGISRACTGWLLGNSGHLITNHHCIKDAGEAGRTTVEFMAEAATCSSAATCMSWGACKGTVPAVSLEFLYTNENLDYTVVQLNAAMSDLAPYGYLRLRNTAATVGENVYIPQYPLYYGKRISLFDNYMGNTLVEILSTSSVGCNITGYSYTGDTQGGSSGSPVISSSTHSVVALHFCGDSCSNTGIPAVNLTEDLVANTAALGGQPASFDMFDTDGQNAAHFGVYIAPTPAPSSQVSSQFKFDGVIQVSSDSTTISVDQFEIDVVNDGDVVLDVISQEISDSNTYSDVNKDCKASYIDAIVYLFAYNSATLSYSTAASVTSYSRTAQTSDASVSSKDPYVSQYLAKNSYLLAVGAVGTTAAEAYAGSQNRKDIDPSIYNCRNKSTSGSYQLTISSSVTLLVKSQPAYTITIPATCPTPAASICS